MFFIILPLLCLLHRVSSLKLIKSAPKGAAYPALKRKKYAPSVRCNCGPRNPHHLILVLSRAVCCLTRPTPAFGHVSSPNTPLHHLTCTSRPRMLLAWPNTPRTLPCANYIGSLPPQSTPQVTSGGALTLFLLARTGVSMYVFMHYTSSGRPLANSAAPLNNTKSHLLLLSKHPAYGRPPAMSICRICIICARYSGVSWSICCGVRAMTCAYNACWSRATGCACGAGCGACA